MSAPAIMAAMNRNIVQDHLISGLLSLQDRNFANGIGIHGMNISHQCEYEIIDTERKCPTISINSCQMY